MNKTISIITGVLLGIVLCTTVAAQDRIMIFVPDNPDKVTSASAWAGTSLVISKIPAGTTVVLYNGFTQYQFGSFVKPRGPEKAVLRAILPHIREFRSHLVSGANNPNPTSNRVHIPAITRTVQTVVARDERPTRVLVFGSLYFNDPNDSEASFSRLQVPNDATINAPSYEMAYGTSDRRGVLEGVTFDICSSDTDMGEIETKALSRFWANFLDQLGASMTSCQTDAKSAAMLAMNEPAGTIPITPPHDLRARQPRIMHVNGSVFRELGPVPETVVPVRPEEAQSDRIQNSPETTTARAQRVEEELLEQAEQIPLPERGMLNIAAVWTSDGGNSDVDLYVRPRPGAGELCFSNTSTPEGKYLRDIQSSGSTAWEGVEIKEASITTTSVWLNLYATSAQRTEGFVRVIFSDRTVDVPFSFGNTPSKAAGSNARTSHPAWLQIDIARALRNAQRAR